MSNQEKKAWIEEGFWTFQHLTIPEIIKYWPVLSTGTHPEKPSEKEINEIIESLLAEGVIIAGRKGAPHPVFLLSPQSRGIDIVSEETDEEEDEGGGFGVGV